jgi:hypothetical protein
MSAPIGRKRWAIAEGYIPPDDPGKDRRFISHETACILNASAKDAHVAITLFFRDPVGPYTLKVGAAAHRAPALQ